MKVKLVFEKSFSEIKGLSSNGFARTLDIELPDQIEQAHLVSARCYGKPAPEFPNSDAIATIWFYEDESRLVGKLLTYIDATFSDKEQRRAHKDIVKDLAYSYFQDLHTRASQTVDAYPDK